MTQQEQITEAVESAVRRFIGIPKNIIQNRAEEEAEKYVSQTMGLEDSKEKEDYKKLYMEMFNEILINQI